MSFLENRFVNRVLHKVFWASLLPLCALWGVAQTIGGRATMSDPDTAQIEHPTEWQGTPLRPLALSEVEQRFVRHFPGTLARLTDGRQVLVLRTVNRPTRMLHPATDCYRGLGYRIRNEQLEARADNTRWRCFVADRGGRALRVCDRIEDARGQGFTDASAWYWASVAGQSIGPWKAITVATPL
jgi:hypothetical protein